MKYEVNFHDYKTGATSPIDTVEAPEGYTARQYIKDCKENADDDWNEMLNGGEVTLIAIDETPTVKEIIQKVGMTQTAFAKRFDIPLRTIQNWYGGQRECPTYVRKMMVEILKEEMKMKIQFEAGTGRHFDGVNFLIGENDSISIYAEVEVPEGASEDYGYITMKNAILAELTEEEKAGIKFWYDGQEQHLAEDAKADCEVYTEIER